MNFFFKKNILSDSEIIKLIQNSEEDESKIIALVYDKCFLSVKKYVTSNGGTLEDVKDVFQDSILMFYRNVKENQINKNTNIKAYLYNTASNKWKNILKKRNRKINIDEFEIANKMSTDSTPFEIMHSLEKEAFVIQLINKLDEKCRQLLKMVFYQRRKMKEVSLVLGYKNDQIARNKQYKCIQKLKVIINNSVELIDTINSMK